MQAFIGKNTRVLIEDETKENLSFVEGLTDNYLKVRLPFVPGLKNIIVPVRLKSIQGEIFTGEYIDNIKF